jgi:hypothetical protein
LKFFFRSNLGCDFQLNNDGDCATQCLTLSKDDQLPICCQVGCTLSSTTTNQGQAEKPILAVDPVQVRSIYID